MSDIKKVSVKKIIPDENQPRKYFAVDKMATLRASIKRDGILNPILVEEIKETDTYSIIDGERRFRTALELGITSVPITIVDVSSETDKLLKQFQIQEMHEAWTSSEKAYALVKLSGKLNQSIMEICKMLGITRTVSKKYAAFASLTNQAAYIKSEISLEYVPRIISLRSTIKRLVHNVKKEKFDRNDEKTLETAVIRRIKDGSIRDGVHFTQIKDSISKDIKYLDKFLNSDITPEAMFYGSAAQGAYHLRNIMNNVRYISHHVDLLIEANDMKLSTDQISFIKKAKKSIEKLLENVE